ISFSVSTETDIEVSIIDRAGRVVRHLACGVLGSTAPLPLKGDALEQNLLWDRRDDSGNMAEGIAFQARVVAGTSAKLEKILGWDGNTLGDEVAGLAVGPQGELFVLTSYAWYGRTNL